MTRRGLLVLFLAMGAFTLYGSLVPFHYVEMPFKEAVKAFRAEVKGPISIDSRSDFIANVLLGVPLGFSLLGMVRVDRRGGLKSLVIGAFLWPICVGFASAVEFSQLYFPGRSCSMSDVVAQAAGSAIGMLGWIVFGQGIVDFLRRLWDDRRTGGATGQILLVTVGVILTIQLLPMDFNVSPGSLYHRVRDGGVVFSPFAEYHRADGTPVPHRWSLIANGVSLIGLFFPLGWVLAQMPFRPRSWMQTQAVFAAGFAFAFATECAQLLVSRQPSVTDVLWGGFGSALGWMVGGGLSSSPLLSRFSLERKLLLCQVWFAMLVIINWQPFDFGPMRIDRINWVPLADLVTKNYLGALDEFMLKIVLFLPVGGLFAPDQNRPLRWDSLLFAGSIGALGSCVLEFGQTFLMDRYPSLTDPILAAMGSSLGALFARRAAMGISR